MTQNVPDNTAKLIETLKAKLNELREKAVKRTCAVLENELVKENEQLRGDIQRAKWLLIEREIENGKRQFYIPQDLRTAPAVAHQPQPATKAEPAAKAAPAAKEAAKAGEHGSAQPAKAKAKVEGTKQQPESAKKPEADKSAKGDGKAKEEAGKAAKSDKPARQPEAQKAAKAAPAAAGTAEQQPDIRRIEFRIGRVVEVSKHPEADSLYIERVDVGDGEGRLRTVVSGLVKHVREEELRGRIAIFMTNLKPAKLRGTLSEGMIMCAANEDKSHLEILTVPPGCQPGDRVFATGFEDGEADKELNPKHKVWDDFVKPVLRTNADGIACYRDAPLRVRNHDGPVRSNVKNAQIS